MKEKFNSFYRNSIVVIAFIIPSAFYGLTLMALSVVFICWLYSKDYKNFHLVLKQPQILLPVLFYFYIIIGFFFSNHFGKALSSLSTQISFLLFPIIIGTSSVIDKKLIDRTGQLFVISVCLFLSIALGYALWDIVITHKSNVIIEEAVYKKYSWYGLTRVFDNWHPTYVSMFANFAIALQLHKTLNQKIFKKKSIILLTAFVLVFLSVCIFLLNSLIGIASYILLLLYFFLLLFKKFKVKIINQSLFAASFLIFIFLLFYRNPFKIEKIDSIKNLELKVTDNYKERNLLTIRMAKWETYSDIIKHNWLWGTTYGDINFIREEAYLKRGFYDLAKHNYNAHNEYIEVFATYGIAGLFIFFFILVIPFFKKCFHPYLIPFYLVSLVTFFTESVLSRQQGILFFMFFFALFTHRNFLKLRNS